jgi:hypothetical protein
VADVGAAGTNVGPTLNKVYAGCGGAGSRAVAELADQMGVPYGVHFTYASDFDGKGAVHWIGCDEGRTGWTNPAEAGRMTVTWSSDYKGKASDAVGNVGTDSYTSDRSGSWWQFDLKSYAVAPTKYSLRLGRDDSSYSIRTWTLQGSNDGSTWTDLRVHVKDDGINASYGTKTWSLDSATSYYRYFRIIMKGPNKRGHDGGKHRLALSGFEIYGTLRRH